MQVSIPISYPKSSFPLTSGRGTREVKFFSIYINHASNNGILKVVFLLQMNAFSVNSTQENSLSDRFPFSKLGGQWKRDSKIMHLCELSNRLPWPWKSYTGLKGIRTQDLCDNNKPSLPTKLLSQLGAGHFVNSYHTYWNKTGWKWSVCSSYTWTVDRITNKWDNRSYWFPYLTAIVAHLLLLTMDCVLINKRKLLSSSNEVKRTKSCKQTIREKEKHVTSSSKSSCVFCQNKASKKPGKFVSLLIK